MKTKESNKVIILTTIISVILGIILFIYIMHYYNIKIQIIIKGLTTFFIVGVVICLPYIIAENKAKLVNQPFKVDIINKINNDEHIRITEENILFKYKNVIKYYYIFPEVFSNLSLKGEFWRTPTYDINNKVELPLDEVNTIIEKIDELNNNIENEIVVRYNGNLKYVNANEVNKILKKYNIIV